MAAADSKEYASCHTYSDPSLSCEDIFAVPTYALPRLYSWQAGQARRAWQRKGARITRRHTHAHARCSLCLLGRTGHRRQRAHKTTALRRVHLMRKQSVPLPQGSEFISVTEKALGALERSRHQPAPLQCSARKATPVSSCVQNFIYMYGYVEKRNRGV